MKSERRHELQHNDLAEWATKAYETVAPYRNAIIGAVLLLIVGGIAWTIWRGHSESQAAESWNAMEIPEALVIPVYRSDRYPGIMEKVSNTYSGTRAAAWAQVCLADSVLYFGENLLLVQKDAGTQNVKNAMEIYKKSLPSSPAPMARERALFGIARALESLGQLQEATAAYNELNRDFPQGTYKAIADGRLAVLSKPETAEFYEALAKYTPKPKKEAEKSAAGPRGKAEGIAPLPENPEEPLLKPPVKPADSSSGSATSVPKASASPPAPAVTSSAAPKPTAAMPAGSAAPAAPDAEPAKKDK